jgi:hypothetical protein
LCPSDVRSDCYTEAFPDAKLHVDGQIVAQGDTVATPSA